MERNLESRRVPIWDFLLFLGGLVRFLVYTQWFEEDKAPKFGQVLKRRSRRLLVNSSEFCLSMLGWLTIALLAIPAVIIWLFILAMDRICREKSLRPEPATVPAEPRDWPPTFGDRLKGTPFDPDP